MKMEKNSDRRRPEKIKQKSNGISLLARRKQELPVIDEEGSLCNESVLEEFDCDFELSSIEEQDTVSRNQILGFTPNKNSIKHIDSEDKLKRQLI